MYDIEEMDEQEKMQKRFNEFMDEYGDSDSDDWDGSSGDESDSLDCSGQGFSEDEVKAKWDALNIRLHMTQARTYQSENYLGPDKGIRYTVVPGTEVNHHETLSYGYSWIGVNVNDTIIVLTYSVPICKRLASKTDARPYGVLTVGIAEMLGLRDPQRSRNRRAVVFVASAAPGQECAPGLEFQDVKCALDFLEEKMNADCSSLSPQETQQIAVCALQYLIGPAFKPNRIDACGWGNLNGCNMLGDGLASRLRTDLVLQAINQPASSELTATIS